MQQLRTYNMKLKIETLAEPIHKVQYSYDTLARGEEHVHQPCGGFPQNWSHMEGG